MGLNCLSTGDSLCRIGLSAYFWLGFVLVALVLGVGNVILWRRRVRIAQEEVLRLELEKQQQDRTLL